jgi:uncharacterized protein YndB with AHSA1/START domain/uncharacterized protein YciI
MTIAPVRRSVVVRCAPERAFAAFCHEIGAWWPLRSHSVNGADAAGVRLDPRVGGTIVETAADGSSVVWGTVLRYQPPRLLAFSWHPGWAADDATEVQVRFAEHPDGTLVELEHTGWERHPRGAAAREDYTGGWVTVLRAFRDHGERPAGPPVWQVLQHSPGPAWRQDVPAGEQPGIEQHYAFVRGLLERGLLVAGGPLLDGDGEGMTVARFGSLQEAVRAATEDDPSVAGGLLAVRVRPWLVPMTIVP